MCPGLSFILAEMKRDVTIVAHPIEIIFKSCNVDHDSATMY
jgi:hypothetical protein